MNNTKMSLLNQNIKDNNLKTKLLIIVKKTHNIDNPKRPKQKSIK